MKQPYAVHVPGPSHLDAIVTCRPWESRDGCRCVSFPVFFSGNFQGRKAIMIPNKDL